MHALQLALAQSHRNAAQHRVELRSKYPRELRIELCRVQLPHARRRGDSTATKRHAARHVSGVAVMTLFESVDEDSARWAAALAPLARAGWCLGVGMLDARGVCVHSEGGMADVMDLVRAATPWSQWPSLLTSLLCRGPCTAL